MASKIDRDKKYDALLNKSIRQHEAWNEHFDREKAMLLEFPVIKQEVRDLAERFDQHLVSEKEERERDRADRDRRQGELDSKLDALLDIKSKAVFLWRVAKIVGTITIGILTFIKLIMPFLRPLIESWIRHLGGK